jgi:hypothetical protein
VSCSPTARRVEVQRHFGVTPPSVHQMILAPERAGFIRRQRGVPRSIEVLVPLEIYLSCKPVSNQSNVCAEVLGPVLNYRIPNRRVE